VLLRVIDAADVATLAQLYHASYPPAVGATTLDDAMTEMKHTFGGAYGALRLDLSLLALADDAPAGAVLTTATSIWDDQINAPFIIDFFVDPDHRQAGIGRLLLENLADRADRDGASRLALRVNDGTSSQAHHLYKRLGFRQLDH
jgi:GNAT superfamily N-acetyltransferase